MGPKEPDAFVANRTFQEPERARLDLDALAGSSGGALSARAAEAALGSIDPDRALRAIGRVLASRRSRSISRPESAAALGLLSAVGSISDFLPRLLVRRPRWLDWLAACPLDREKTTAEYRREIDARVSRIAPGDTLGLMRRLRLYKYREILRVATRDVQTRASPPELMRELSSLAEACLSAALLWLDLVLRSSHGDPEGDHGPGEGFCVLGMGKLGAQELNFSSDVDLLYVYAQDGRTSGGTSGPVSHRQHWSRLAEQLTRVIGEVTEEGFVFRVDLNLRPDGRNGPIVSSLEAMESYYESFGRTWERAALLKARPVAGDLELGARLLQSLAPFVWRRSLDFATLDQMRALKEQINRRAGARGDDLKLGLGGIREVEFFIQSLQLLHGGKDARLRDRSTLGALANALFAGLVTARDHDALADAYLFLRRLEHRVQMIDERQTHTLPEQPAARERLARSLGFGSLAAFETELARHRTGVNAIFEDILQVAGAVRAPLDPVLAVAVDPDSSDEARTDALGQRGFRDPAAALHSLARLAGRPDSPFAQRGAPSALAVRMAAHCAASPDPDRALFHLAELFSSLRAPGPTYAFLEANPATARLLASLFGTSDFLSKYFLRHPELLDSLVQAGQAVTRKGRERMAAELATRLERRDDPEGKLSMMRRFKNEEVLRIGLNDVAGNLDLDGVHEELSDLADAILVACLDLSCREALERYGAPHETGGNDAAFTVIGLGKLGGREMGYHSDLDLVFLYSDAGETQGGSRGRASNAEFFSWLAQRLLSSLSMQLGEGHLYRADARLRPSGNQGVLVVTERAFREHQRLHAQVWERQALTRARWVAGAPELWQRVQVEVLDPVVYRADADPARLRAEILRVRERMERELAQENETQYNPKLGRGGLVDIEFIAQYLQLVYGAKSTRARVPGTCQALEALIEAKAIDASDAVFLQQAWRFLRRLENRLRIVHDHPMHHMPRSGPALEMLARRLGYSGREAGAKLLGDYETITRRIRGLYERVLR
jgi:glutamate-ammonia-ligase adenylyltransferase